MIIVDSLNLKDGDTYRNSKSIKKLEIEEVKQFREYDPRSIRVRKNMLEDFKQKLI